MEHWSDTKPLQKATSPENHSNVTELVERSDDTAQHNSALPLPADGATINDSDRDGVSVLPPHPLQAFPKEFNKNFLSSLDRRYVAILFLTLLLEPLLIWYLLRTHPLNLGEQDLAKLQNKYAELFLSEFKVENEPPETPSETDILSRASEAVPKILDGIEGVLPGGAAGSGTGSKPANLRGRRSNVSPEARGLSGENREAVRRLNAKTRQRGMQALSEEVERIGLLGVITSGGSGLVSRAPVTDILQYADSTVNDIDQAIAQVRQLRVPRAGVDYFGPSAGSSHRSAHGGLAGRFGEVHIAPKEIRGSRATSSGIMPEDIVTGLAAATQKNIERNQKFEHVASAPDLLPSTNATPPSNSGIANLRSRVAKGPATRERDRIRELVLAHNPAIQDCYRRQLKGNSALKGKVTVRFTIDPLGHVVEAQILSSAMTAGGIPVVLQEMENCILNKILRWRDFGQVDESRGEVTFRQTYNFGY